MSKKIGKKLHWCPQLRHKLIVSGDFAPASSKNMSCAKWHIGCFKAGMIEKVVVAAWLCIFALLCLGIKRTIAEENINNGNPNPRQSTNLNREVSVNIPDVNVIEQEVRSGLNSHITHPQTAVPAER